MKIFVDYDYADLVSEWSVSFFYNKFGMIIGGASVTGGGTGGKAARVGGGFAVWMVADCGETIGEASGEIIGAWATIGAAAGVTGVARIAGGVWVTVCIETGVISFLG